MIQKLAPSRFQWFCRKGHPLVKRKAVPFPDVLAYPVVLPEMAVWGREWFAEQMAAVSSATPPPFRPSVVCSHFSTLKSIVQESDAVSALTELALRRESYAREFAVIDYAGMTPSSNPGIVTMRKRPLPPAAMRLVKEVVAVSGQG